MKNKDKQQQNNQQYMLSYDKLYSLIRTAHIDGFRTYEKISECKHFISPNDYATQTINKLNR